MIRKDFYRFGKEEIQIIQFNKQFCESADNLWLTFNANCICDLHDMIVIRFIMEKFK